MLLFVSFCGCAGLQTNLSGGEQIANTGAHVMVFPLSNPYYKGREIAGTWEAFAAALASAIQASGRTCRLADTNVFSGHETTDVNKAFSHANENGCGIAITGSVTEWLDGATQWSGRVDVEAATLRLRCEEERPVSFDFRKTERAMAYFCQCSNNEVLGTIISKAV